MTRQATVSDIRNHYQSNGHIVRISRDGRVTFRQDGKGPWLDGRWTEDYKMTDDYGMVCNP